MCVCVCVDDVYVCVLICNGEKFELDTSTMASGTAPGQGICGIALSVAAS